MAKKPIEQRWAAAKAEGAHALAMIKAWRKKQERAARLQRKWEKRMVRAHLKLEKMRAELEAEGAATPSAPKRKITLEEEEAEP